MKLMFQVKIVALFPLRWYCSDDIIKMKLLQKHSLWTVKLLCLAIKCYILLCKWSFLAISSNRAVIIFTIFFFCLKKPKTFEIGETTSNRKYQESILTENAILISVEWNEENRRRKREREGIYPITLCWLCVSVTILSALMARKWDEINIWFDNYLNVKVDYVRPTRVHAVQPFWNRSLCGCGQHRRVDFIFFIHWKFNFS